MPNNSNGETGEGRREEKCRSGHLFIFVFTPVHPAFHVLIPPTDKKVKYKHLSKLFFWSLFAQSK